MIRKFIIITIFVFCGCFKYSLADSQFTNEEVKTMVITENDIKGKFGKKIALLIGVHNPPPDTLEYTTNDVENIGRVLTDEFGYEIKKIIKKDATKNKILKAFDNLLKETGENDQVIIFFSGHGITAPTNPNIGFLFPSDGDKNNLLTTAINISEIQTLSRALKAKHVLFWIDSCYSGIAGYYKSKDATLPEINMVRYFIDNKARQVLTAGKAGETALMDPGDKKMSLFTYCLKEGLTRGPDNYFKADFTHDNFITAKELYIYVQKIMFEYTNTQHPEYYDYEGTQAEFLFLPRLGVTRASPPPEKTETTVSELPKIEENELRKIKDFLPQLSYDLSNLGSTLGKLGAEMNFDDKKVVSGLLQLLIDSEPLMRWRAAVLLFRSQETAQSEQIREKIAKVLINTTDKIDMFRGRQSSIEVLVRLHSDEAQDLLLHLAKADISNGVRQSAIKALKKVGKDDKKKEEAFVYVIKFDDDTSVQVEAMTALTELYPTRARKEIPQFLSVPYVNDHVFKTAIRLIGDLKIKDTVGPLLNILKTSSDPYTIGYIVDALIKIDDERAITSLSETMDKLSNDSYPEKSTRENIRKYLEKKKM